MAPFARHTSGVPFVFLTMITLAAGTSVLRWLSDSVEARGLGDGISLLIALNIVSSESCTAQSWLMPAYSTGPCIDHSDPAGFCGPDLMGTTCIHCTSWFYEYALIARTVHVMSVFYGAHCQVLCCTCKSVSKAAEDLLVRRPSQSPAAQL